MSPIQCKHRRCDGVTRRQMLRVGALTAFGLGLTDWSRREAIGSHALIPGAFKERRNASAKRCILIWLDGGPSHLETFDPKPMASREVRGPLAAIPTSVPGIRLGECLSETAKRMDKIALIRSMTSPLGEHNFGTHYLMTGFEPTSVLEYPTFAAVGSLGDQSGSVLPSHIAVPDFRVGGGTLSGNGFLPGEFRPFSLGSDPAKPDFRVPGLDFYPGLDHERIQRRKMFVEKLQTLDQSLQSQGLPVGDAAFDQAFQLISSPDARAAFDLEQESADVRRRYGTRTIGQSCLLARRLVECGVPFVTVNNTGWDTHESLVTRLKDGFTGAQDPVGLIPSLDLALSALLDDLADRRLLDETLVVVMGEFGRTPKINTAGGRDHWPRVFSVLMAGGGIDGGQVVGASDKTGEQPDDRPVTPAELVCTIYKLLGIDPDMTLTTRDGRPVRVTRDGIQPVSELTG